jgi:hypothetical protein
MKPCNDFYIQSALRKIENASRKEKGGCRLTFDECRAFSLHDQLADAFGDYDQWEFDEYGQHIDRIY